MSPHYFHHPCCWSHMNQCFHTLNQRWFSFMVYFDLPLTLLVQSLFITYFIDHTWTIVLARIILNFYIIFKLWDKSAYAMFHQTIFEVGILIQTCLAVIRRRVNEVQSLIDLWIKLRHSNFRPKASAQRSRSPHIVLGNNTPCVGQAIVSNADECTKWRHSHYNVLDRWYARRHYKIQFDFKNDPSAEQRYTLSFKIYQTNTNFRIEGAAYSSARYWNSLLKLAIY